MDESALRAALSRAYDTFVLMHGTVSAALRTPAVAVRPPTGSGSGGGVGTSGGATVVSGFEVLRRLASARKRLRKAKAVRGAEEVGKSKEW